MKYNLEIAKDMFKEQGLALLEEEYKSSHIRMFCVDDDGYKYSVSITQLLSKDGYKKFSANNPYTIDNIKNYIRLNGIESELLSTEYKNNSTNLKFLCKCGEEFETSWASFLSGKHYCLKCQKQLSLIGYRQEMIKQAKQEFADKGYTLITDEYFDVEQKMEFKCNLHPEAGVQTISWRNFYYAGCGCRKCGRQIVTDAHRLSEDEIKALTESKGFIYVGYYYKPISATRNKTMIKYICPRHRDIGIQEMNLSTMRHSSGKCHYCINKYALYTEEDFLSDLEKVNKDVIMLSSYIGIYEKISCKCKIDGNEWETTPYLLLKGVGCKECSIRKLNDLHYKSTEDFKAEVEKILPNVEIISEYNGAKENVWCKCKIDGAVWATTPDNLLHAKVGCPKCQTSRMEEKIEHLLDEWGIKYIYQKRFADCKDVNMLPFDFYLTDYNFAIEYDGEHHYKPIPRGKDYTGEESFEIIKRHDKIKDQFCERNNIFLLRIPYWDKDNIEYILFDNLVEHGILEVA